MRSPEELGFLPVSEHHDPFKIREEDYEDVRKLQVLLHSLQHHRQEIGRLFQMLINVQEETNKLELQTAEKRRDLVSRYGLESTGGGQWAVDFEKKEFVRLNDRTAVIP